MMHFKIMVPSLVRIAIAWALITVLLPCLHVPYAQPLVNTPPDSSREGRDSISKTMELPELTVIGKKRGDFGMGRLRPVEGTAIYDGKKNEVIEPDKIAANSAANNARQLFAKVPGINVWESDGAGLQMGIGARGLSPKRTSEFNTRLNGYDLSADALGYPESYYTPPAEGLQRIELVRGAASLQYGTQFGGMVNFSMKQGAQDRPLQLVSRQTSGSNNFINSFNSLGGSLDAYRYYGFYQFKQGNDYRPNSGFDYHGGYVSLTNEPTKNLKLTADLTVMRYLAQQPGGLTDMEFQSDPYQTHRERNWFRVAWNLAALRAEYKIDDQTFADTRFFGLLASRDALGFLQSPNRGDLMLERDLLRDNYENIGQEVRVLRRLLLWERPGAVLIGVRAYHGSLLRRQGLGSDSSNADFRFINPNRLEGSDYRFPSRNYSLFSELILPVSERINVTPGFRVENVRTESEGTYNGSFRHPLTGEILLSSEEIDRRSRERTFPLFGIGMSVLLPARSELYANVSQNYRAINFNDMRVNNPNLKVDPDLKDETGFNADLGVRGDLLGFLQYDIGFFYLSYQDRIGSVLEADTELLNTFRYRTNVSDSRNIGMEGFMEVDLWHWLQGSDQTWSLPLFGSWSLVDARYVGSRDASVREKRVELVPPLMLRTGLGIEQNGAQLSLQYSYTAKHYTEATNAEFTADAINGAIPAYWLLDLSGRYRYRFLILEAGCNNLTDREYFTRRADGYPGPGIIPSPGRTFYFTAGVDW